MLNWNAEPYLAMQRVLTESEREVFLTRLADLNPGWRGAHVADVLSALDNTDAHLDVVEPLFERHRGSWSMQHRLATYCAIWIYGKEWATWENVSAFVARLA